MKTKMLLLFCLMSFAFVSSASKAALIGYWKLDEDPNTNPTVVVDSSGSGNNGAVIGNVGFNSNYGDFRTTVMGDYIDLPNDPSYTTLASFTWAARVRSAPGFTDLNGSIMGRGENAWASAGQQTMRINGNPATPGTADFQAWGMVGVSGTTPVNDGNWHHVAVTYDDVTNRLSFYTDGILEGAVISDLSLTTEINFQIDIGFQRGWFWSELDIEEVRIYNNALSSSEVATLAGTTVAGGTKLVGYWKLDEDPNTNPTVVVDSSGFGRDGAIMGNVGFNSDYGDFRTTLAEDYIDLPNTAIFTTLDSFSWAANVRSAPGYTGSHGSIMGRGENAWASAGQQTMRINGNPATPGTADFQVWGIGGVSGTTPVNDGNWHHVAVTYDLPTTTLKFYTDGILEGTTVLPALATATEINYQIDIGFQRGWFWSELDIEEVRIYSGSLSPFDVMVLAGNFTADFNKDGAVNVADLEILGGQPWLATIPIISNPVTIDNFEPYFLMGDPNMQARWGEYFWAAFNGATTTSVVSLLTNPADAQAGSQAMRWEYNDAGPGGPPFFTSIIADYSTTPIDMSNGKELRIWLNRHVGNSQEELMFVALNMVSNDAPNLNRSALFLLPDTGGSTASPVGWSELVIDLSAMSFSNHAASVVDLTAVVGIEIGCASGVIQTAQGAGIIDVDSIVMTQFGCPTSPVEDLNQDCEVNLQDFSEFSLQFGLP